MDVLDFINNRGQVEVKNPNYNPKSKKNTEPPTLIMPDFGANQNQVLDIVRKDLTNQISAPTEELKKYRRYGLNWNPNEDMDLALAEAQGAGSKIANSLVQTVAEVGLGIPLGFADLADLVGNAVSKNDNDYQNPVTRWLEDAKQSVKEWAPVYADPNISIDNGGLTNIGWLASNFPSVASSLSLLIPSMAVTRGTSTIAKLIAGAGKVSKGAKAGEAIAEGAITLNSFSRKAMRALTGAERRLNDGKKLNKFQEVMNSTQGLQTTGLVLENGLTAAMSRAMENYQESRQTYDDVLQYGLDSLNKMTDAEYQEWLSNNSKELDGIDTSNKTEVAKRIASNAADLTNKMDWINVTFDIIQLFALRNAWKGFTNSGRASAEVKQLNKEAAAKFKPVTEGTTEEAKKFANIKKAGNWIKNKVYDSPFVVAAQLSEGAEEAINYVAQQEGITYAKVLLDEMQTSSFDTRLQEYMRAPELHDAAFWGVMGGVIFQKAGSGFNRLRATIDRKNREKKYKDSDELAKQPWYKLEDLADIKAQKSDINARVVDTQKYIETLKKINDGINPYSAKGTAEFTSEVEKEDAKEQAYNEWLTGMTLRAVNAGTIGMQKAFITDENVKAAMVEAGIATQQNVDEFAQNTVDKIQEIEDLYNNELINASHTAAYLKQNIPAEYLNLIATNNVYNKRSINILNKSVNNATDRINVLLEDETIQNKLKNFGEFNYDNIVKLVTAASRLRDLRSTKRKLNQDNKDNNNLSAQISIQKINKEIQEIENNLNEEELVYATWQSLATYDESGNLVDGAIESNAYKDAILVNRMGQVVGQIQHSLDLDVSNRAKTAISDAAVNRVLELDDIIKRENEIKEISPELFVLYSIKHNTQQAITSIKSNIVRSVDDVTTAVNNYDKMMNIARVNAIAMANGTLSSLYEKYGNEVKDLIVKLYNKEQVDTSKLDSSELEILKDSLNILDITNENNIDLVQDIYSAFDRVDAKNKSNELRENSSTNQDDVSDPQNLDPNNNPQTGQNPLNGQETGQGGNLSPETKLSPTKIDLTDANGVKYAELELTDGSYGNDVYNLKLIDLNNSEALKYLRDDRYFVNKDSVSIIDSNNTTITEYPKVVYNQETGNVVPKLKGVFIRKNVNDEQEVPTDALNEVNKDEEIPGDISSTGGETQTQPSDLDIPERADLTDYMVTCKNAMLTTVRSAIMNELKESTNDRDTIINNISNRIKQQENQYKGLIPGLDNEDQTTVLNQTYYEVNTLLPNLVDAFIKAKDFVTGTFASKCVDIAMRQDDKKNQLNDKDYLELIDLYCKEKNVKKINNTYYISVENLLRFANGKFSKDSKFANLIFYKFKDFVKNGYKNNTEHLVNGNNYYVIIDRAALDYNDYLENVYLEKAEVFKKKLGNVENKTFDLDIYSFLDYAKYNKYYDANGKEISTDEIRKQFNDTLNTLQKGDELTVRVIGKDGIHLGFFKNGKICATIPITTYDTISENSGVHSIYNDGWITDVNDDGPIVSNLRNLFSDILKDARYSTLRDALFEDTFIGKGFGNKGEHILRQLVDERFIAKDKQGNAQWGDAYYGLCKLLKYTGIEYESGDILTDDTLQLIEDSLDEWFLKIRDSYNFAYNLLSRLNAGTNPKVVVIKAGNDIIEYTTNEKAGVPSEKLADLDTNPLTTIENYKIGITNSVYENIVVSGRGLIPYVKAAKSGYTYVVAYSKNGEARPIGAFPQNINSNTISNDAKEIVRLAKEELTNNDDLRRTICDLFPTRNDNNVLFKLNNGSVSDGRDYTQIKSKNVTYKIYNDRIEDENGNSRTKEDVINFIFDNTDFYLSKSLIASDNNSNPTGNRIIEKTPDGITIKLRGREFKYRSYNDFILKNDLVNVTTFINNESKSNFKNITTQRKEDATTSVKVKLLEDNITPPVEENVDNDDLASVAPRNVIDILNDNTIEDKGTAILDNIDDENLDYLKNIKTFTEENASGETVQLLPKKIEYNENFNKGKNKGVNAEYTVKTNKVTVGPVWLNSYNSNKSYATRLLIHEQLHSILRDKKENTNIDKIRSIYDEFSRVLNDKNSDEYKKLIASLDAIKGNDTRTSDEILSTYLFNDEEKYFKDGVITREGLEEFLIESLTSRALATALNNIEVENAKINEPKTLLQKILKFLSDLFGWGINENSLYAKELNLLGKPLKKQSKEAKKDLGEKIEFTDDKGSKREFYIKDNVIYKKDGKPLKQTSLLNRVTLQYELDKDLVTRISHNGRTYVLTTNGLLHEYSAGFIKRSSKLYEDVINSTSQQELQFDEQTESQVEEQKQIQAPSILNEEDTPSIKTDMFSTREDVVEHTNLGEFNSLNSYITSQPVEEQEFVKELVENGVNTIKCK